MPNAYATGIIKSDPKDAVFCHKLTLNQRRFLRAFIRTANVTKSCQSAGLISVQPHYYWLKNSEAYRAAFEAAKPIAAQHLEDVATQRADEGWLEPVFQGGRKVGHVRKFSDRLLELRLMGELPDKYKRKIEHSGEVNEKHTLSVEFFDGLLKEYRAAQHPAQLDDGKTIDAVPAAPPVATKPNGKVKPNGRANGRSRK